MLGEHDFTAVSSAQRTSKTTVRRIYDASVYRDVADPRVIQIEVTGNGFLYNMVRIIAGTLADIGRGPYARIGPGRCAAEKRPYTRRGDGAAPGIIFDARLL